jgi:hypothetical protein
VNRGVRIIVGAAAAGAGLVAGYWRIVRPWARRWGATEEEAARPLPGDQVVTKADFVATRAITIDAPPHDVWPWLVQIGSGRAGWYTYDRIDNAGMPSATEIIPELTPGGAPTRLQCHQASGQLQVGRSLLHLGGARTGQLHGLIQVTEMKSQMAHPGQNMHPQLAVHFDAGQREGTLEVLLG